MPHLGVQSQSHREAEAPSLERLPTKQRPQAAKQAEPSSSSEKEVADKQANDEAFHPDESCHLVLRKAELVLDPQEGLLVSEQDCTDRPNDPVHH